MCYYSFLLMGDLNTNPFQESDILSGRLLDSCQVSIIAEKKLMCVSAVFFYAPWSKPRSQMYS